MTDGQEAPTPEALEALARLVDIVADRGTRDSFRENPRELLGDAHEYIPERLLEAYLNMDDEALDIIVDNCELLKKAGFGLKLRSGGVLCYH
jgi:hypothetical protein